MRSIIFLFGFLAAISHAGDYASGDIKYEANFKKKFNTYSITKEDKAWVQSLISNFKYQGKVIHFVKTDIELSKAGESITGQIYQSLEKPELFYVLVGDVMLNLKEENITSTGTGGFSVHAPKTKDFIACLNCQMGVPFSYWSHSSIGFKKIRWKSSERTRL